MPKISSPWLRNTAEGRWYGLGRYLAMFPASFAQQAIDHLTTKGEPVLDPCCGRGNGPFTAAVLGRPSVAIDINPAAWIFTATKLQPEPDPDRVVSRLNEMGRATRARDKKSRSRFETMAWSPKVRAFLKASRRELDWKGSRVDRTLMAFIALHMQDKLGSGLSNAMSPTIAYSPDYAVKWWTMRGLSSPPDVDPIAMLATKIRRRYECGVPTLAKGNAILGDARVVLRKLPKIRAGLLITSPPYCGAIDYWNDNWLRLWLLGHEFKKNWNKSAKYGCRAEYQELLQSIFGESSRHLKPGATVLVRAARQRDTATMCAKAMAETWPKRPIYERPSTSPHRSISVHHGRGGRIAKEIDLLIPGKHGKSWWEDRGFMPCELV
ncbi:MAG: hypothetical protein F4X44_00905 [Gammaproteobacteria bacterium]|nr:hypothetical protein [Gammaproteobacteria bacterium]MYD79162.1 hypothetical protein [Gammaproteobacteria bacterium]